MLQVIQHQKTGKMFVEDVPEPQLKETGILVQNVFSLISAGTEKSSVQTAQASLIGKAMARPDLVKQVLDNWKREGLKATYDKVQNRLATYKELGYSCAGLVIDSATPEFRLGDRVSCGGVGYAAHAEVVFVPKNLAVPIPSSVTFEEAAFCTVGAIALQGVRQAEARLGETVAVIGLGMIGLITVQLLKANGCKVIGLDISEKNFDLAMKLGCDICMLSDESAAIKVESLTKGYGTDAVILTAATSSNQPLELAMMFARKKSKLVIVGSVGMRVPRSPFYEKELELRISCSYGPGRYDPQYEEGGIDYPHAYVRWTERRNMEAVLSLITDKKLDVSSLISHRFTIQEALHAYDLVAGCGTEEYLGVLIEYHREDSPSRESRRLVELPCGRNPSLSLDSKLSIGFLGAGNFAQSYLIPPLQRLPVKLKGVATLRPVTAKSAGNKFKFEYCTTNPDDILNDDNIGAVFIATRHDSHAQYIVEALKRGKHIFVEKPLAINELQLREIKEQYISMCEARPIHLTVGFNRRFSQPCKDLRQFFYDRTEPIAMMYRVNAGSIPREHWIQQETQGGRIVGETCHFIDCMMFIIGAVPVRVYAECLEFPDGRLNNLDSVNIIIKFSDGSIGNLIYLSNGDSSVEKEYLECYAGGNTAIINNFVELSLYRGGRKKRKKYDGSKGHREEVEHFVNVLTGKEPPGLSFESIYITTLTTFKIIESLNRREAICI